MRWDAGSDAFCIDRLDRCLFPGTRSCSLRWSSECDKGGARHRQVVANKSHFACKRSIVTVVTQSHEILRTHWLGWPLMTRALSSDLFLILAVFTGFGMVGSRVKLEFNRVYALRVALVFKSPGASNVGQAEITMASTYIRPGCQSTARKCPWCVCHRTSRKAWVPSAAQQRSLGQRIQNSFREVWAPRHWGRQLLQSSEQCRQL